MCARSRARLDMTIDRSWPRGVALVALALVVYVPALGSGFVWDDDAFLTGNPLIAAADGLARFWFSTEPPDYFPLTSTTLWLEWRLWGASPLGYHATNVLPARGERSAALARARAPRARPGRRFAATRTSRASLRSGTRPTARVGRATACWRAGGTGGAARREDRRRDPLAAPRASGACVNSPGPDAPQPAQSIARADSKVKKPDGRTWPAIGRFFVRTLPSVDSGRLG